jgi:hypothetical protein
MYKIISLFFFIAGLVLFFAPDYILTKENVELHSMIKMAYEYHQVLGFGIVILGYYIYTLEQTDDIYKTDYKTESIKMESVSNRLPSSEKITELS